MANTLVKSKYDEILSCPRCGNGFKNTYIEEKHEFIEEKKIYPSCYHYNVIVMLAKRLVKEQEASEEKLSSCINRWFLDRKLARRIADA